MEQKMKRIRELVPLLNEASKAYYQESREIISNLEYDKLYDELVELEKVTGIILSNSPTINVGYEVLSELPKEAHEFPMLSLDKTKDVAALKDWLSGYKGYLSWKLDGLTIVLTYQNGKLAKAVTRGNGEVGEVITNNAKVFKNIPLQISFMEELIIRGEAVIKYSDFMKINEKIEDVDAKYKNPRNLCSGSVRQLNNQITADRNVHFYAFSLVRSSTYDPGNSKKGSMDWLKSLGFDTVQGMEVDGSGIEDAVTTFSNNVTTNDLPSDGLVLTFDDIAYGYSLGSTSKFPRDSIAFKWEDECKETVLKEIEWSASRTGLINPIAVFEPVELEGTTVSRASVHNLSIMESLELGIGDHITVYKANMIIPQIADNATRSNNITIPDSCPVCQGKTIVRQDNDVKELFCTNDACQAKIIKGLAHFVSRDAMNIDGLSEATLQKFMNHGIVNELIDIFHLRDYKEQIVEMEGLGEKSYNNLIQSIDNARKTTMAKFIYSLGIANIGLSNAKLICREFQNDMGAICRATSEQLVEIQGVGGVIADKFTAYFQNESNLEQIEKLLSELDIETETFESGSLKLDGLTFVITGSIEHFANRSQMKEAIEKEGGKVTGTVSAKTNYLINNDNMSNSSKNKKAKELNIPILTEEELLQMI